MLLLNYEAVSQGCGIKAFKRVSAYVSKIVPVIMSGGAGSRLWPLSRRAYPKQLLPLIGDETMVQQTAARLSGDEFAAPVFICNADHAGPIADQMKAMGSQLGAIITEPVGRNTAPVAVVAALHAQAMEGDNLVLLAPADHYVTNAKGFRETITRALPAARNGKLVTFGIAPDGPETGYGYIEQGDTLYDGVYKVAAFAEKPDLDTAQGYIDNGNYSWNAGIFLFSPAAFLSEIATFAPEILAAATRAYNASKRKKDRIDLEAVSFADCPPESIDYAVMEKTKIAAVVPCDIGWNDIGSYAALHDVRKDDAGLSIPTGTFNIGAQNCLVETDGPRVALVGVENISVIVNDGVVMVVALNKAQDVKKVVDQIKLDKDTHLL